jgi:hypothetical protein
VVAGAAGRTPRVHLINPLWDWNGGADRRTAETWRLLRTWGDVAVWSEYKPAPEFLASLSVRRISPLRLSIPFGGTMVFVGVYFRIGHWIRLARPQRIVIFSTTPTSPTGLLRTCTASPAADAAPKSSRRRTRWPVAWAGGCRYSRARSSCRRLSVQVVPREGCSP